MKRKVTMNNRKISTVNICLTRNVIIIEEVDV